MKTSIIGAGLICFLHSAVESFAWLMELFSVWTEGAVMSALICLVCRPTGYGSQNLCNRTVWKCSQACEHNGTANEIVYIISEQLMVLLWSAVSVQQRGLDRTDTTAHFVDLGSLLADSEDVQARCTGSFASYVKLRESGRNCSLLTYTSQWATSISKLVGCLL